MKNRQESILKLLNDLQENIQLFEIKSREVTSDLSVTEIQQAKVKSSLEQIRSCLDYLSHDIYETIIEPDDGPRDKIYFPYGKVYSDFNSSLCKNGFRNLKSLNYDIYALVESIQPLFYLHDPFWDTSTSSLDFSVFVEKVEKVY